MKLEIRTVPDPILRRKSKPVVKISSKGRQASGLKQLAQAMIDFIKCGPEDLSANRRSKRIGVGLSAVQIGKPLRLFVAYSPKSKKDLVFVNPKITWRSKKLTDGVPERESKHEGCLSVPGYLGIVKRAEAIRLRYRTLAGREQERRFSGFFATVIQHEMDHLNGVLFIDRALEQKGKIYKLEENSQ